MAVYRMRNRAQNYDWGSRRMVPAMQAGHGESITPTAEPVAEIWMGTHPRGLSSVDTPAEGALPLPVVLGRSGPEELPFLFKILTAERGLSIQTHPSRAMAVAGFRREEAQGVDIGAPHRTYRDQNHKPELLCAIHDFWGLRGFRPLSELQSEMRGLAAALHEEAVMPLRNLLQQFVADPGVASWREVFATLLSMAEAGETAALERSLHAYCGGSPAGDSPPEDAKSHRNDRYWWCRELLRQFPGDVGAAAPLYLNLVHLHPGEAVFLEAGVLHAYLYGAGVELMASSDNVLRAGCTSKHVDRGELLQTVSFTCDPPVVVQPATVPCGAGTLLRYRTVAEEFELLRLSFPQDRSDSTQLPGVELVKAGGAAVVLAVGGTVQVGNDPSDEGSGVEESVILQSTESALVDYTTRRFLVQGRPEATVYVASLPGTISCGEGAGS